MQAVTAVYPGSGDAQRSLTLLWNGCPSTGRGPKPALDLRSVVGAAIELADNAGLGAASMRSVAQRLGRSAMSLYTYVPGKAELLDLMHDQVLAELDLESWSDGSWRDALERSARDVWAMYERHPWMLQISEARASLGPHSLDVFEAQAQILDRTGLPGVQTARLVGAVQLLVQSAARVVAEARDAARVTGQTDDEWWLARAAALDRVISGEDWTQRYPTLSRMTDDHVFEQLDRAPDDTSGYLERDALDSYELGLRCLLDGIEQLITRHSH